MCVAPVAQRACGLAGAALVGAARRRRALDATALLTGACVVAAAGFLAFPASLFALSDYATTVGGKGEAALDLGDPAKVHTDGNAFREAATATTGSAVVPFDAPYVPTLDVAAMEPRVRAGAGCLPRDDIDRAYLGLEVGWRVGESEPFRVRIDRR